MDSAGPTLSVGGGWRRGGKPSRRTQPLVCAAHIPPLLSPQVHMLLWGPVSTMSGAISAELGPTSDESGPEWANVGRGPARHGQSIHRGSSGNEMPSGESYIAALKRHAWLLSLPPAMRRGGDEELMSAKLGPGLAEIVLGSLPSPAPIGPLEGAAGFPFYLIRPSRLSHPCRASIMGIPAVARATTGMSCQGPQSQLSCLQVACRMQGTTCRFSSRPRYGGRGVLRLKSILPRRLRRRRTTLISADAVAARSSVFV